MKFWLVRTNLDDEETYYVRVNSLSTCFSFKLLIIFEYMFPHSKQQVHIACTQFLYSLYDMVLNSGVAITPFKMWDVVINSNSQQLVV